MGQLHCYVPKQVEKELRKRAEREHLSISQYLALLIRKDVGSLDEWPESFFENVFGCMHEDPLQRPPQGTMEDRESLY